MLLEPIMELEVTVPDEAVGAVNGDLNSRRGRLHGMEPTGGMTTIKAEVPMAEMLTYSQSLTSLTGGRGDYHMHFLRYEEVPTHIAQKVIEATKKDERRRRRSTRAGRHCRPAVARAPRRSGVRLRSPRRRTATKGRGELRASASRVVCVTACWRRLRVSEAFATRAANLAARATEVATIVGTPGADKLIGTNRADVIVAAAGTTRVSGLGGNDVICAGPGNDVVNGGRRSRTPLSREAPDRRSDTSASSCSRSRW